MREPNLSVARVRPAGYPAAAKLLFTCGQPETRATRIERFLKSIHTGEYDPGSWFAAWSGSELVGTAVVQFLPSGSAVVLPPVGSSTAVDALADAVVMELRQRRSDSATVFLDPADATRMAPLVACGFRYITDIQHRQRAEIHHPKFESHGLQFQRVDASHAAFGETLLATYEGSLDVPEAISQRPASDILAGYQFECGANPMWWLAQDATGQNIGVILLQMITPMTMEITYLGVVPTYRNRGFGRILLMFALGFQLNTDAMLMNVSVDARNVPAIRLYEKHLFQMYQLQQIYLWQAT